MSKGLLQLIKVLRSHLKRIKKLKPIKKDKENIDFNSIFVFKDNKNKGNNDKNNKKRENIIVLIINKKIPKEYYKYSLLWRKIKEGIELYIKELSLKKGIVGELNVSCIQHGGRGNNYDFDIIINDIVFNVEFKFNVLCLNDAPQFLSLGSPSKYLTDNFERWFYDNYLTIMAKKGNLEIPLKEEYCKYNKTSTVDCLKLFKDKYDTDSTFNKLCKQIDKKAIKEFIENTEINMSLLSEKLLKSQKNKHYMCFYNNSFYYDKMDDSIYRITILLKKTNTSYIYKTQNGLMLDIKLRFKNGCGIQFPALQIQRKIPKVNELKVLCDENNITLIPRLKADICKILDQNNIKY